jgi:predicted nuclease of predicted toxin-antitoxin system
MKEEALLQAPPLVIISLNESDEHSNFCVVRNDAVFYKLVSKSTKKVILMKKESLSHSLYADCLGEGLRLAKERMNEKNVYYMNPSFDK